MQIALYVCRPLNGKHKTNNLCVLCASAVNTNSACLNNYCRISNRLKVNFPEFAIPESVKNGIYNS